MIIKNNSVEQINIALLEIESAISRITNASELKSLKSTVESILRTLNETKNGLESGATYNINITGNARTATSASTALSAENAVHSNTSEKAISDEDGNNISETYQNKSEKNPIAGYVSCDKTANGTYVLSATVNNGVVSYNWILN
jgi:hypothetical protein